MVFSGQVEITSIADGLLLIAREGWNLDDAKRCECAASPPGAVVRPLPPTIDSDTAGTLPIQINIPPPRNPAWPVENGSEADVALYLPQPAVEEITSGPYLSLIHI